MVNIVEQIYEYENSIFENIATFLNNVTGLPVYLKDKPFIIPDSNNSYLTIRMVTSGDSGGVGQYYTTTDDGCAQYVVDNNYTIEIMAFRGRPLPVLNYVLGALVSFQERRYEDLYSNGISFLSASNVTEANTVLDGDKTRLGARLIATFNTRMIIEDTATTEITQVKYKLNTYSGSYEDTNPIRYEGNFSYVTT